ncbi:hypothetical protein E4U43_007197, partial [Claviceps pusilla]
LDRTNLANAYASGMKEDLRFAGNQLNEITTYLLGQAPSNLSFVAIRFFQGVCEASIFVGTHYILGAWYTGRELGKRSGIFTCAGLSGTLIGGFIQSGLFDSLDGRLGLAGWPWLSRHRRPPDRARCPVRHRLLPRYTADHHGLLSDRGRKDTRRVPRAANAGPAAPDGQVWNIPLIETLCSVSPHSLTDDLARHVGHDCGIDFVLILWTAGLSWRDRKNKKALGRETGLPRRVKARGRWGSHGQRDIIHRGTKWTILNAEESRSRPHYPSWNKADNSCMTKV